VGWRSRVLFGRLRDQGAVVATVTLVSLVATTLLGTFAFLLDATSSSALDVALGRLPAADVRLEASIRVKNKDSLAAVAAADEALTGIIGDVDAERSTWLTGRLWVLPTSGAEVTPALAYPASSPLVPDHADLVSGTWPVTARDDAGRVPVNVPAVAAERYGWTVGTEVPARPRSSADAGATWLVVGTHELTGPAAQWHRDRLGGAGHDPAFPVPGAGGRLTTEVWGPVVVVPEALAGPGLVESAHLVVDPDLGSARRGAVAEIRDAVDDGQIRLTDALGDAGVSGIMHTRLAGAIDSAWRALAVTRVGVVVVGLLLVVLATAVMLLAARLLGERRAGEGALLAARGASPGQLRSLAVTEAALLAVLTTAVAAWGSRLAFTRLADGGPLGEAGLVAPDGVPVAVLLACAAVAVVLAVALVLPSWHVAGSSSTGARAGLVRAGADLALVALAAVALWQLLSYGAPLTHGAQGPRLDPVLAAGPALVALGAAVLARRLVGPVARLADVLAGRGRSLVAPLAAWQVARRPAAAAGTTLVLVLAVTVATFSHAFLGTWTASQLDQVDLALGTDARVDVARGERLTASSDARAAASAAGARLQPVTDRTVTVGRTLGVEGGSVLDARLLAVDTADPTVLRGRSGVPWASVVADLADPSDGPAARLDDAPGVPLPGEPGWLVLTVTPGTAPTAQGVAYPRLAVEDDAGVRSWLSLPGLDLGSPTSVTLELPRTAGGLRVVAASAVITLVEAPLQSQAGRSPRERLGNVGLALHDARVVDRAAGATSAAQAEQAPATPLALGQVAWDGLASSGGVDRSMVSGPEASTPDPRGLPADALVLDAEFDMVELAAGGGRVVARTWPTQDVVRAVVTQALADRLGQRAGGSIAALVGDARVQVRIDSVVPYLPGVPRGSSLLVDRTALSRALAQAGGTDPLLDTWWVTAPDDVAAQAAAAVSAAAGGSATVRVTQRADAVAGPLAVPLPAALSLVTGAAGVLVLVGLATSATAAVRSRRLELARLQALGAARPALVGGLLGEHALLVVLGAGSGLAIGYGLAAVVAPVLTVSSDGRRPVPTPLLSWDWSAQLLLTAGLAAGACLAVAVIAAVLVRRASGTLLRLGDDL